MAAKKNTHQISETKPKLTDRSCHARIDHVCTHTTVYKSAFSLLTLLVGQQQEHLVCKYSTLKPLGMLVNVTG